MSCCSRSIDEARHERLKALADSINETARMARATLALLLMTALYLGFTLLSSTDENLLLNAQVAVLQVGFGMALEQSYIFGPPIFLYLHVQGLFLLNILARKVRRFKDTLGQEPSGIPDSCREEYWNWLSAFAFVQLFRRDDDGFHFVPRSLMWISMEAIPLLLLLIVDLSFVRYQSEKITNSHHVVFLLDLFFVIWFNLLVFGKRLRLVFGKRLRSLQNNLSMWFSSEYRWRRLKKGITSWRAATWISLREACTSIKTLITSIWTLFIWTLFRVVVGTFWTWSRLAIAGIVTLLLFSEAQPPSFDIISIEKIVHDMENQKGGAMQGIFDNVMIQRRNRIWGLDDEVEPSDNMKSIIDEDKWHSKSLLDSLYKMWKAVQQKDVSVLDIGPCQWWGFPCRYLSARDLWLVSTRPTDVFIPRTDESDEGNPESIQWSSLNELSLAGRNLRFADFRFTHLQGANLEDAELQGANLERAKLWNANLARAKMNGAHLLGAELQYANLSDARLRSTNLRKAKLQRALLYRTKLWNANLQNAKLQRAIFTKAELQGANMQSAHMDIASLYDAKLTCTNLRGARLRGTSFAFAKLLGTDLEGAQLQGAKFREAELLGTNLAKSQLEGVDFYKAKIRLNSGEPESWKPAWMRGVDTGLPALFTDLAEEFASLIKEQSDIGIILFWNNKNKILKDCVTNILTSFVKNDWPPREFLSREKEMISDEIYICREDIFVPEYWRDWVNWTIDFACKNDEYTGYSSVYRWNSENPLSGLNELICPKNSDQAEQCILDKVKKCILDELDNAPNDRDDECPGLRAVPDGGWRISDSDWRKVWKDDD